MAGTTTWSWYVNQNRPAAVAFDAAPVLDGALEKLAKLFPFEVITVFTAADQFARAASGDVRRVLLIAVAVAGLVLLPGAFARFRDVHWAVPQGRIQILIGVLGYVIWVYAQGVLSAEFGIYNALVAGVVAFLFLGIVVVYGPKTS